MSLHHSASRCIMMMMVEKNTTLPLPPLLRLSSSSPRPTPHLTPLFPLFPSFFPFPHILYFLTHTRNRYTLAKSSNRISSLITLFWLNSAAPPLLQFPPLPFLQSLIIHTSTISSPLVCHNARFDLSVSTC